MNGEAAPVIDVATLRADVTEADETIDAIHRACTDTGFFVVTGHGLGRPLTAMFTVAAAFFDQPDEVKSRVAMVDGEGFVPVGTAPLDPRMGPEAKERLDLGLRPSDRWPALTGFADTARGSKTTRSRWPPTCSPGWPSRSSSIRRSSPFGCARHSACCA